MEDEIIPTHRTWWREMLCSCRWYLLAGSVLQTGLLSNVPPPTSLPGILPYFMQLYQPLSAGPSLASHLLTFRCHFLFRKILFDLTGPQSTGCSLNSYGLQQCFSNFRIHPDHLLVLLKGRFWFGWSGVGLGMLNFLTSSLVILSLLIQDHALINNGQKLRLLKAIHLEKKEDREKPPINRLSYRL